MAIGIGLSGIFTAKSAVPPPPAPINLFTQDLTLAANKTHDLNGNSVTFLKSNFEFRAPNGNSGERVIGLRNHTDTGWLAEFRNDGSVYFGSTLNSQTFVNVYGSVGAYNRIIHNNGGVVTNFTEGSGFQGVQFSGIYMFTTSFNGGGVNGVIGADGNWFIMANPYFNQGAEANLRFNIISKGITEASGNVFKLKHVDIATELLAFTSFIDTNDGYIIQRINTSAIADSRLENSQFSFSIDEGTDIVTMKIKKSNGTVITKTLL